jgi:hypothetical protein
VKTRALCAPSAKGNTMTTTIPPTSDNLARYLARSLGGYDHANGWHVRATVDGTDLAITVTTHDADEVTFRVTTNDLLAEVDRLKAKLDAPCGSCHPCTNYADETWRAAGRTPPHVYAWDELNAEVETLRAQRDRLLALHEYDELIFGGYICTHCTPDDADDPDQNVYWPCPSLRAVGVIDDEGTAIILARRAEIARKAAQEAGAA